MGLFNNLFEGKNKDNTQKLEWKTLKTVEDLDLAINESKEKAVVLFKHSTRCSISSSALSRLERNWSSDETSATAYMLDLISYREVSNAIAEKLSVTHQSPQMIIVKNGEAAFNASHMEINFNDVVNHAPAKS